MNRLESISFATVEHHQYEGSRHEVKRAVAELVIRSARVEIEDRG